MIKSILMEEKGGKEREAVNARCVIRVRYFAPLVGRNINDGSSLFQIDWYTDRYTVFQHALSRPIVHYHNIGRCDVDAQAQYP